MKNKIKRGAKWIKLTINTWQIRQIIQIRVLKNLKRIIQAKPSIKSGDTKWVRTVLKTVKKRLIEIKALAETGNNRAILTAI
jgi:hypothetical protein